MAGFNGFGPKALGFFTALKFHQSKEWFEENRGLYESDVLGPMVALLDELSAAFAQASAPPGTSSDGGDLESVTWLLLENIQALSDYRSNVALPPVFQVPQHAIEVKVCDEPCNVSAAYIPREGIYLAANLDPIREPLDRSALLHELVHYLQQGHPKFAGLAPCERERSKEQEAYAIQNAYLASIDSKERVIFYAGDFDCEGDAAQR